MKYAVEVVISTNSAMVKVVEPLLEGVVFDDIPKNMASIKREIERRQMRLEKESRKSTRGGSRPRPRLSGVFVVPQRLQVLDLDKQTSLSHKDIPSDETLRLITADMSRDFGILRTELEWLYGDLRTIPSRSELRACNRSDIEKALAAHGGASTVAKRLGWKYQGRSRKPRGYWNSLDNVKREIDDFIISSDLPPGMFCFHLLTHSISGISSPV